MQLVVRGSPQEYECCVGAWEKLERHLNRRAIDSVLVLHGGASWNVAKPFFPAMPSVNQVFMAYGGQCTDKKIHYFSHIVKEKNLKGVIAVGGGKVSDLAKAVTALAHLPLVILPTLASTCAAWTPLSVVYREDNSVDRFDVFPFATALVLIEPVVILHSPMKLMIAGIGDTMAKWYEADCMISQLEVKPVPVQIAEYAASRCRSVLFSDSEAALQAMRDLKLNQAFLNIVETNIMLGGLVGGFGDEFGRTSGAHAIHDAFTLLPQCHVLHGCLVAYSVLVQLSIEKKWEEITRLLPFYQSLQLPTCLVDLNLGNPTQDDLKKVAEGAAQKGTTIHFMKEAINAKVVEDAIVHLDEFIAKHAQRKKSSL